MNIVFCYPTEINYLFGGVERVTYLLSQELYKRGHQIFFLNNYFKGDKQEYDFIVKTFTFPQKNYDTQSNVNWFHNFLKENKIDIVINQTGQFGDSILYCNTGGVAKSISVAHMSPEVNLKCLFSELKQIKPEQGNSAKFKRLIRCILYPKIYLQKLNNLKRHYKWISNNTDRFVLLSERFYPSFKKLYPGKINLAPISNPLTYPIIKDNKKENLLVWVGRMDNQKRPDLMVKIWKKINRPDWKLIMIGDGVLFEKTKKQAKGLNNIEFTGFTDPLPYYQKVKILCMTSGHEGFGMVLTEAISQGCVPISFESFESIRDIIDDDRQLVKPMNVSEYVAKLNQLMSDDKLREELRKKGYKDIEKFKVENIVNQWENLFNEVLAE